MFKYAIEIIKMFFIKIGKICAFLKVMSIKTENVVKTVKSFKDSFCLMFLSSERNFIP